MTDLKKLGYELTSIAIYHSLLENGAAKSMYDLLQTLHADNHSDFSVPLHQYATLCSQLYDSPFNGNWTDYLYDAILYHRNVVTVQAANGNFDLLPETIRKAAAHDLDILYRLSGIQSSEIKKTLEEIFPEYADIISELPEYSVNELQKENWGSHLKQFANFNLQHGVSIFAKYYAFHYSSRYGLEPVEKFDPIRLKDLKHYEVQRQKIIDNTLGLLQGKTFNNVLLYGDRGTGKSSTVKALLNEYKEQGLRMVEIPKQELTNLDKVIRLIQDIPLKFILFIDDLAFEESDPCFGILKALLEGSLVSRPNNIAVYATTNRRHLVKETFAAREGDEVHRTDTIDEALSLSDRFGLYVTFTLPDKAKFLDIVRMLANDRGIDIDDETLFRGAEQFAMRKSGRSPRLARQYIDYIQARKSMNLPLL